jgi:hypothetical protein
MIIYKMKSATKAGNFSAMNKLVLKNYVLNRGAVGHLFSPVKSVAGLITPPPKKIQPTELKVHNTITINSPPNRLVHNHSLFDNQVPESIDTFSMNSAYYVIGFEIIMGGMLITSLTHPRELPRRNRCNRCKHRDCDFKY